MVSFIVPDVVSNMFFDCQDCFVEYTKSIPYSHNLKRIIVHLSSNLHSVPHELNSSFTGIVVITD